MSLKMSDTKAPSTKIQINEDSSSEASDESSTEEDDCPSDDEFVARMQAKLASASNATPSNNSPSAAGAAVAGGSGVSQHTKNVAIANRGDPTPISFQAFEGTRLRTGGILSAELLRAVVASLGPEASPTLVQSLVWRELTSPSDLSTDYVNRSISGKDGRSDGSSSGSNSRRSGSSAVSNITMKTEAIDLLALSKTGSGKTVAFAVPVLAAVHHMICGQQQQEEEATANSGYATPGGQTMGVPANEGKGQSAKPLALVLAPTRELCLQISSVFESLLSHTGGSNEGSPSSGAVGTSSPLEVFCAVGGMHYGRQHAALLERTSGPAILVATPGRLLSLCGGVSASTLARNPSAVAKATTTTTAAAAPSVHVTVAAIAPTPPKVMDPTSAPTPPPAPPTSDFMALLASAGVMSSTSSNSSNDTTTAPPSLTSLQPSASSPFLPSSPPEQPPLSAGGEELHSSDACAVSLSKVQLLVVDEADRLCSDEFQSDMAALSKYLVQHPVRLLFSATWGEGMDRKATRSLGPFLRPLQTVRVSAAVTTASSSSSTSSSRSPFASASAFERPMAGGIVPDSMAANSSKGGQTDGSSTNSNGSSNVAEALVVAPSVRQSVEVLVTSSSSGKGVGRTRRLEALLHSLKAGQKALVFVLHKTEAKALAKHLNVALGDADSSSEEDDDDDDGDEKEEDSAGSNSSSSSSTSSNQSHSCSDAASTSSYAGCLHGDMSTLARSTALTSFRNGEFPVLVCTDVAARGLDVPGVALVVNMSVGMTVADYVHRCGRTGRAGQKGRSHTFLVAGDEQHAPSLIKVLGATRQDVPPLLVEVAHRWEVKAAKDAKKKAAAGANGGSELDEDEEELQLQRVLNREKQRAQQQAKINKGNANAHKNKKAVKGKGGGGGGGGGCNNGRR